MSFAPISGIRAFLADPVGAMEGMARGVPTAPVAAMALVAATLLHVVLDYTYGPIAFPASVAEGGKRASGPFLGAVVALARVFSTVALIWLGGRLLFKTWVSPAAVLWLTVPYAIATLALDGVEITAFLVVVGTGLNMYGALFLMGWVGTVLVLILGVRALYPDRDWLACLPVGLGADVLGYYLPAIVLPVAAIVLLTRRKT